MSTQTSRVTRTNPQTSTFASLETLLAQTEAVIEANAQTFLAMVIQAQRLERRQRDKDAIVAARAAADFASTNHTGMYVSPVLEALLLRIGQRHQRLAPKPTHMQRSGPMRVLHVLTAAYDIGGHTRLLWRWIERDAGREHSVVLTHQRTLTPPQALRQSVERSGGRIYNLDVHPSGLLKKARQLADLREKAHLVVLHTHPYDVLPLLAFAPVNDDSTHDKAPIALLNQADHVFWLARSVSSLIVDFRHSGRDLSISRRGIPAANTALLPLPLQLPERRLTRAEAKTKLGLSPREKLIFSVALPYKYTALGEVDFARIFSTFALEQGVTVLVVGPERDTRWANAEQVSGGRLRALGRRSDLSLFHQAADIYVDSFPFGSATSLLEAGSYGVPVLTFSPVADAGVMTLDDPALPSAEITRTNLKAYCERLRELLGSDRLRQQAGQEIAARIAAAHTGEGWQQQLEAMYALAQNAPPMSLLTEAYKAKEPRDLLLASLSLLAGRSRSVQEVVTEHVQLLPLNSRLAHVLRTRERPGRLLSDWLGQQYELLTGRGRPPISG